MLNNKAYLEAVNYHGDNKVNNVLTNKNREYMIDIVIKMFSLSNRHVRLIIESLNDQIFNDIDCIESINEFVKKPDAIMDVIVTGDINIDDNRFSKLTRLYRNKITVKHHPITPFKITSHEIPVHFCVFDNTMYHMIYGFDELMSRSNFNDPQTARRLIILFEKNF